MSRAGCLRAATGVLALAGAAALVGCGGGPAASTGTSEAESGRPGPERVVLEASGGGVPLARSAVERFAETDPTVPATLGGSPGEGLRALCRGRIDLYIGPAPGRRSCPRSGARLERLPVATEGAVVVANPALPIGCMTVTELRRLWRPGSTVVHYSDLDPRLPNQTAHLYAPGPGTGPFALFTERLVGRLGATRTDYRVSVDQGALLQAAAADEGALGYLGFSLVDQNPDKVRGVAIDAGDGCVRPSRETIQSGRYAPLSRPVVVSVRARALERPAVRDFIRFVVDNNPVIGESAQLVPMDGDQSAAARERLDAATAGPARQ